MLMFCYTPSSTTTNHPYEVSGGCDCEGGGGGCGGGGL